MKHRNMLIALLFSFLLASCDNINSQLPQPAPITATLTVRKPEAQTRITATPTILDTILVASSTPTPLIITSTTSATSTRPVASSTSTPRNILSPTATVVNTPTTTANTEIDNAGRTERIYVWDITHYGFLDPDSFNAAIHVLYPSNPDFKGPDKAEALAFSDYSGQVAYLTKGEQNHLELWVANLDLTETTSLWIDDKNWLGITSIFDLVLMRWGLGDQFIIMETDKDKYVEGEYFGVVYSIKDHSAIQLLGRCNTILVSPESKGLALGCPMLSGDDRITLVLEQDGSKEMVSSLPDDAMAVKDWIFSPDGSQVLYVTKDDKLNLSDVNLSTTEKLPIGYASPEYSLVLRKVLQWSRDGTRLLIYGDDGGVGICPTLTPCWVVVERSTFEIIWKPDEKVIANAASTLSPDGERIVFFRMLPPFREVIVVQVDGRKTDLIYDWAVETFYWDSK